jgi:hypothetical protein
MTNPREFNVLVHHFFEPVHISEMPQEFGIFYSYFFFVLIYFCLPESIIYKSAHLVMFLNEE